MIESIEITVERIYMPAVDQSNALNAAADKDCRRVGMAGMYADCLRADTIAKREGLPGVDWKAVNAAILKRWPKGLNWIKERAWKMLREGR